MYWLPDRLVKGVSFGWILVLNYGTDNVSAEYFNHAGDVSKDLNGHAGEPIHVFSCFKGSSGAIELQLGFDPLAAPDQPAHRLTCNTCSKSRWFVGTANDNPKEPCYHCTPCCNTRGQKPSGA
jgi:hypothetical protein